MTDQGHLRASDADRERVAEMLRTGAAEGRIDLAELDERLRTLYATRTYAELAPIVADLPAAGTQQLVPAPGAAPQLHAGVAAETGAAFAVLGAFHRKGPWVPPRLFRCLAYWGGGKIDLRDARFFHGELTIQAFAFMGGVEIVVPQDADVTVTGVGIMGGFDHTATGAGRPGAPRIVITGLAVWGGVSVARKPPRGERTQRT